MKRLTLIFAVLSTIAVWPMSCAAAVRYSVTALGYSAGGGVSINDSGQIAGSAGSGIPSYLLDDDAFIPITGMYVEGINNQCQIVGGSGNRAVVWQNGTYTYIPTPADVNSFSNSSVLGINTYGDLVGYYNIHNEDRWVSGGSFVWRDGVTSEIPTLGGSSVDACDINDLGCIVGGSSVSGDVAWHAFTYMNDQMLDLGVLPNRTDNMRDSRNSSEARDINNVGSVVGQATVTDSYSYPGAYVEFTRSTGFIWRNGLMTELVGLPGCFENVACAVNDLDQVVGRSRYSDQMHAWLWENGNTVDLNDLIDPNSGWVLNIASDINNNGQIVGCGTLNGVYYHQFLLTPVTEPTSLAALICALGGMCLNKRKTLR